MRGEEVVASCNLLSLTPLIAAGVASRRRKGFRGSCCVERGVSEELRGVVRMKFQ